ncbi:MAG: tetratricopeptide repeat protein [bacterium]
MDKIIFFACIILIAWLMNPGTALCASSDLIRKGNKNYDRKDYKGALEKYSEAQRHSPEDMRGIFNSGDALYRLGEYERAGETFELSSRDKKLRQAASYNEGNALFRREKYAEAAAAYRKALIIDSKDSDAKYNLQAALERLRMQGGKQEKKEDKKEKDKSGAGQQDKQNRPKPDSPKESSGQRESMSKEDAERILQTAREKEKASRQPDMMNSRARRRPASREKPEQDW